MYQRKWEEAGQMERQEQETAGEFNLGMFLIRSDYNID